MRRRGSGAVEGKRLVAGGIQAKGSFNRKQSAGLLGTIHQGAPVQVNARWMKRRLRRRVRKYWKTLGMFTLRDRSHAVESQHVNTRPRAVRLGPSPSHHSGQHVISSHLEKDIDLDLQNCTSFETLTRARSPATSPLDGARLDAKERQNKVFGVRIRVPSLLHLVRLVTAISEQTEPCACQGRAECPMPEAACPASLGGSGVIQTEASCFVWTLIFSFTTQHPDSVSTTATMVCPHCNDFSLNTRLRVGEFILLCDIKASARRACAGCSLIVTGVELCCPPRVDPDSAEVLVPHSIDIVMFYSMVDADASSTAGLFTQSATVRWSGGFRSR